MKIGFFDSGLGGLVILKEVAKALPQYDYTYYGDTKNLPYGEKTEEEIYELTKQALVELFKRDCLLVIVACNTASSQTLRKLQDTFLKEEYPDRKVLGVIIPTMEELSSLSEVTRAILLATKRTADSRKYDIELDKLTHAIGLTTVPMPQLVPLLENKKHDEALAVAIGALRDLETGKGEVVILGCTHYTLLKEELRSEFPDTIFLSQDEIIPRKLSDYLTHHPEITSRLTDTGERSIHLTEHRADYDDLAGQFLGGVYLPNES